MLVGVSFDQASVDRKVFTADEAGCETRPNDALEHLTRNKMVAEASLRARENTEWSRTLSSRPRPQNQR